VNGFLEAWGNISSYSTVYGFKIRCISNSLNGSEDSVLWEVMGNFTSVLSDEGSVGKDVTDNSKRRRYASSEMSVLKGTINCFHIVHKVSYIYYCHFIPLCLELF
jgi:hypothetical protein